MRTLGRGAARVLLAVGVLLALWLPGGQQTAWGQAAAPLAVSIADVDDAGFPQVILAVDVRGSDGLPVVGLRSENVAIQEDGQPVAPDAITVQPDTTRPLSLVLTVDRSTQPESWAAIQATVNGLLDSLRPDDQVALLVFFDEVQTLSEFTQDKEAVRTALAAVTAGGAFSALNQAVVAAANLDDADRGNQRAIFLITDTPDNVGTVTTADAAAALAEQGVPLYGFGFGERVSASADLTTLAAAAGGRAYSLDTADQVAPELQSMVLRLRQGYRVGFTSSLPADNGSHQAALTVTVDQATGQATADFIARSGDVAVTVPNLQPGQVVFGAADLTAQVDTPAAVQSVEYRVNGEVIAARTDDAIPVIWDGTLATPGQYTLDVTVVDAAGNTGTVTVPFSVVAPSPRLTFLDADSQSFPAVALHLDLLGSDGLPLAVLAADDVTVQEDGAAVPADSVQVSQAMTQPLNLVLAVDAGSGANNWAAVRTIANGVMDGLRPQDQAALVVFGAESDLVQELTGDAGALRSALSAVTPAEGATALHQGVLDAVAAASALPPGRRHVMVITAQPDTTGDVALKTVADAVALQEVPVHVVGLGPDVQQTADLINIARAAGGRAYTASTAAEAQSNLRSLLLLLQPSYRVDYLSTLRADNAEHQVVVTAQAGDQAVRASRPLVAYSRTVEVGVPNLVAGATVASVVNLTAEATTPAPVTSVVYVLDGAEIARVDDVGYTIMWDSQSVAPGEHVLEVTVEDAAGNRGSAIVPFTVVPPIAVTVALLGAASAGPVTVGEPITVSASVSALGQVAQVAFFVDDVQVGTAQSEPYVVTFGTDPFGPGTFVVRAVAQDTGGHEAAATVDLQLDPAEAAPAPATGESEPSFWQQAWSRLAALGAGAFRLAAIGLMALLAIFLVWMIIRRVLAMSRERRQARLRLAITNDGNLASAYHLRAEDAAGALAFEFSIDGVPLGAPTVVRTTAVQPGAGQPAPTAPAANGDPSAAASGLRLPTDLSQVGDTVSEVSGLARMLADFLMTISYFLPRDLASVLRRFSMQLRRGQMMARRLDRARSQYGRLRKATGESAAVNSAGQIMNEAGEWIDAEGVPAAQQAGQAAAGTARSATAGASRTAQRLQDLTSAASRQIGDQATAWLGSGAPSQWVVVPAITAGATVTVDMLVTLRKRSAHSQEVPFRVITRAAGQEEEDTTVEEASVRIEGVSWLRRLAPILLLVVALLALFAVYGFFLAG